jgi:hypothetical protein
MKLKEVRTASEKRSAWNRFGRFHYSPAVFNVAARVFLVRRARVLIGMTACLALPCGTLKNAWRSHKVVLVPRYRKEWGRAADAQAKLLLAEGKRYFCNASDAPEDLIAYRDNRQSGWTPTSKHGKRLTDQHGAKYGNKSRSVNKRGVVVSHEYVGK